MAVLEIVTLPKPVLKRKAKKVTNFGPELQELIDNMVETMRVAPGVGLAATQVNVPLQVIVVEFGDEEDENVPPKLFTMVNPKITRQSKETVVAAEGCLSVPEIMGDVERFYEVTVSGYNRHGRPMKVKAKGWLARIFQHEVDHINGVLFVDRAERVWEMEESAEPAIPAE
ncbi:MAG: peptide deformylase [Chloroflexota bacterium]